VLHEGWVDTYYTNYSTVIATSSNIKTTSTSTSMADLVMVPRKMMRTDPYTYNYGHWEPFTYQKAKSSDFAVRWTWSFNSEDNVKAFAKSYKPDDNEKPNSYYSSAQVEFNTGKFLTLTSTATADSLKSFYMGHLFTKSLTYDDYDVDKDAGWIYANAIKPATKGLCRVDYDDPVNSNNANGAGTKNAFFGIVYRTQDKVAATNNMYVALCANDTKTAGVDYSYVSMVCDGQWHTAAIDITANPEWARTSEQNNNNGIRYNDMVYMLIRPFSTDTIVGGKSIDIAAVGIFSTAEEAQSYGDAYISTNGLDSAKGLVRVITNTGGTVTLSKGGSGTLSSDSTYITGVSAGSTFKVNVAPDAGYYCSKLCWRPTGYTLNGGNSGGVKTTYFSAGSAGNSSTYAADHANVVEYVDVLDGNFMNNGMFTGGTTNTPANWQNTTWGDTVIATSGQIKAYNAALVKKYKDDITGKTAPVDILDMAVRSKVNKVATIQTFINNLCSKEDATAWGLSAAYDNRNYANIAKQDKVIYGVVTQRANIRALPTAESYIPDDGDHDVVQEAGLPYATAVWVLHTSTDGAFYFVQTPYYKGWVDATCIATTTSYKDWIEFADPAIRGDIIVTIGCYKTVNGQKAEMGCAFQLVSSSDTGYTIKVPIKNADGSLGTKDVSINKDYTNKGYLPYTWNNYIARAFRYHSKEYSWGDESYGQVDCSAFAMYVFKAFGFQIMRKSDDQIGTGYTTLMNSKTYSRSTDGYYDLAKFGGTPMILAGGGHTVLYLGCVGEKHYVIEAAVGGKVNVNQLTSTELTQMCNYTIMAPNNYLEDAYVRQYLTGTAKTFTATLETPSYKNSSGTGYTSSTKYTLNHTVDAVPSTSLDNGTTKYDQYVLNSGGRDIYVWAEFTKISNEVALDIQIEVPDGYGYADKDFGSVRFANNMKTYATVVAKEYNTTQAARLVVYKGYRVKAIEIEGSVTRSTASVTVGGTGAVDTSITATYTHEGRGSASESLTVGSADTNKLLISIDERDYFKPTGDGTVRYIIEPISYTIQYNSNYPKDSGVSDTTVTGTHYYNCTGNVIEGNAEFVVSEGPGDKWSKKYTFSAGDNYRFMGWSNNTSGADGVASRYSDTTNESSVQNLLSSTGTYNYYAKWAPVNYNLSVDFISQVDRELVGTPEGFKVVVGGKELKNGEVETTQTASVIPLSTFTETNCDATYDSTKKILSIKSTATSGVYCDVTFSNKNIRSNYEYMTITYKMSGATMKDRLVFAVDDSDYNDFSQLTGAGTLNCLYANWIADGEWHTMSINLGEMNIFYNKNRNLTGIRIPGSKTNGASLDISSIKLWKSKPTVWGESTVSNSSSEATTALKTQGDYGFSHRLNKGTTVNVVSAQQADYGFVMDLQKAYLVFRKLNKSTSDPVFSKAEYEASEWYDIGTYTTVTVNGVSLRCLDVSDYIKNHTFDMSAANFTMPAHDVQLIFVCDYMKYTVKVFTYTAGVSYDAIDESVSVSNTDSTPSKAFTEATVTIESSKNNGIIGRYGSTVKLSVSSITSGKKFLGWYEKNPDATNTSGNAYGKLISTSTSFTLSESLHKNMEIVAVFGSSTSTNTIFNFCNASGQVIQTIIAAQKKYIPITNITARPYKTNYVFSGWQLLKNADKSDYETVTYNSKTYYKVDGPTQPAYTYKYSVLYEDKNCTKPAYIYTSGKGTVYIDACYTQVDSKDVVVEVLEGGTVNGTNKVTVPRNTTVTLKATGSGTFKGWIDKEKTSKVFIEGAYYDGTYYYPYISYQKNYSFKVLRQIKLIAIYDADAAKDNVPMVHMPIYLQRVDMGSYYRYTVVGFLTMTPSAKYTILEWGALFFMAPDANTKPTTTSYDPATGETTTKNILTTATPSTYLQKITNSASDQISTAGQFSAGVNVQNARTMYVRLYCRYSYVDSDTNETVYVVTYSNTIQRAISAYSASDATDGVEFPSNYYGTTIQDYKPSDYENLF